MNRVLLGMSGGVDSSVAAYLLKERGYVVEGISFILWDDVYMSKKLRCKICCMSESLESAKKNAQYLGISHDIMDLRKEFYRRVIKPFVDGYLNGITPNPCILCNKFIKFPYLVKEAKKRGANYISTGHYARVEKIMVSSGKEKKGLIVLKKGVDHKKDQSYVLYVLTKRQLSNLILLVGQYTKSQIRDLAKDIGLPVMSEESQEICFVKEGNYYGFIQKYFHVSEKQGPIIDLEDNILGIHKGIYKYTFGQRKRIGISSNKPLYVVDVDVSSNTIRVGLREAVMKREFIVGELNWMVPQASSVFRASVKIRSTAKDAPADIYLFKGRYDDNEYAHVVFDQPQWAPTPGQSSVFYDGEIVLGGGIIKKLI
jgi:tRNA-specific 2-thiouridylase